MTKEEKIWLWGTGSDMNKAKTAEHVLGLGGALVSGMIYRRSLRSASGVRGQGAQQ
jgi:hypothetical protein